LTVGFLVEGRLLVVAGAAAFAGSLLGAASAVA
jgi:hypothetical protein